jgi:cell division inhibitor SepF
VKAAPQEEYYDDQPKGLIGRLLDKVGFGGYDDEEDYTDEDVSRKKPAVLRVQQARMHYVSVWHTIKKLDNARQAADGLKAGHQQIVNLEQATPEDRLRITDFLNGVAYALDGLVEKVGEGVYLYTPRNYHVEVESEEDGHRAHGTFTDNN